MNFEDNLTYLLPIIKEDYIVIIANGAYPKNKIIQKVILNAKFKICCDGAIKKLMRYNILPNWIIGDLDSINKKYKDKFYNKLIYVPDQNTNDLTKAFNFIKHHKELNNYNIIIVGATGLREDHSIANISLLNNYQKDYNHNIIILSDYGIIRSIINNIKINTLIGQQISFFALNSNTRITCKKLKWPLDNYQLSNLHNGTLNQVISSEIKIKCTNTTIINQTFIIKNS
jgi:thiamine pyrophosphokinase